MDKGDLRPLRSRGISFLSACLHLPPLLAWIAFGGSTQQVAYSILHYDLCPGLGDPLWLTSSVTSHIRLRDEMALHCDLFPISLDASLTDTLRGHSSRDFAVTAATGSG